MELPYKVLYAEAVYGEEEIESVIRVLQTQRFDLMMSSNTRLLEEKVAQIFGNRFGIMVNSGSSANLLAVQSLKLPAGSEVITPALTFATTVAPIIQSRLVPDFIDVDPSTFCVSPKQVRSQITSKTRALLIPNLFGNIPDWQDLHQIAAEYGLRTIQDSADTIGSSLNNRPVGEFSDLSTTSFYASHIITGAGFGGMVLTDSEEFRDTSQLLRGWGRQSSLMSETNNIDERLAFKLDGIRYDAKYVFRELGYNFLPSEISAAFALVQLEKLEANTKIRERNFQKMTQIFGKYPEYFELPKRTTDSRSPWLAYPILIKQGSPFKRFQMQAFFEEKKIQTRTVFTGNILRQPAMKGVTFQGQKNSLPNRDRIMENGIVFGCHHGMTLAQIDYLASVLSDFLSSN
jgi:CDP-6-deoxy-D-xylo-4-hexulose-3-dehydrase